MISVQPRQTSTARLSGRAVGRPLPACPVVPHGALPAVRGSRAATSAVQRRDPVRPGARPARAHCVGVGTARPVRVGCAPALPRRLDPRLGRSHAERRPAPAPGPALRLTRRGRRLTAGLVIAAGVGLTAALGASLGGGSGDLRLAGSGSVVVDEGDTLWSIARAVAPEEDPRAVVYEISEVNDLDGAGLVPGQVLQLP